MSKSKNPSLSDFNKLGKVLVGDKLVDAKTLVDKKPIKFKPVDESAYIGGIDLYAIDENVIYQDNDIIIERQPIAVGKIYIKPLTVNRAWRGRRFKTPEYDKYHEAVTLLLPNDLVVPNGLLKVYYEFGMSLNSDVDNPVKCFTDVLQAKYHFNDKRIMELNVKKVVVRKGKEYISFRFESI